MKLLLSPPDYYDRTRHSIPEYGGDSYTAYFNWKILLRFKDFIFNRIKFIIFNVFCPVRPLFHEASPAAAPGEGVR